VILIYYIVYSYKLSRREKVPKKIKSFTVDEAAYKELITLFKKYQVDVSLSYYVDRCLKSLAEDLQDMERGLEGSSYTVPMAYIIERTVKPTTFPAELEGHDEHEVSEEELLSLSLEDWQATYESEKRRVPKSIYNWLRSGNYELTPDRKYLIHKVSGKKYLILGSNVKEVEDSE
jgi:hypothetical protein